MKAVKCFILTVVFVTLAVSAHAKDMKYAFVDLSRIFDN